jgi:hypothetical protein
VHAGPSSEEISGVDRVTGSLGVGGGKVGLRQRSLVLFHVADLAGFFRVANEGYQSGIS